MYTRRLKHEIRANLGKIFEFPKTWTKLSSLGGIRKTNPSLVFMDGKPTSIAQLLQGSTQRSIHVTLGIYTRSWVVFCPHSMNLYPLLELMQRRVFFSTQPLPKKGGHLLS